MSVRAIAWALDVEGLKSGPKLVLIVLANYADEHNICWPAMKTICRQSGQCLRTVRMSVRTLEKRGILACEERKRGDRSLTSWRYRLILDRQKMPEGQPSAEFAGYPAEFAGHEPSIDPRKGSPKQESIKRGHSRTHTAEVVPLRPRG